MSNYEALRIAFEMVSGAVKFDDESEENTRLFEAAQTLEAMMNEQAKADYDAK